MFKSCRHGLWGYPSKPVGFFLWRDWELHLSSAHLPHGWAPNEAGMSSQILFWNKSAGPGVAMSIWADLRETLIKDNTAKAQIQKHHSRSSSASFGSVEGMKFAFIFEFVRSAQHHKHLVIQPTFNEHLLCSPRLDFLTFHELSPMYSSHITTWMS